MAQIENLNETIKAFRRRLNAARIDRKVSVKVGYTAEYALYVHENMEPTTLGANVPRPSGLGHFWGPSNHGPKFLTNPMKLLDRDGTLSRIIRQTLAKTGSLAKGLLLAGLRLQRDSQELVPVEYGNLRASAFTRLDEGTVDR